MATITATTTANATVKLPILLANITKKLVSEERERVEVLQLQKWAE